MKVLFFSHDAKLGDAIVNTAFVAGLKRHAPGCEIHATVAGSTESFWRQDRRIARLWTLSLPGWRDVLRIGLALRRERYDYIVTWKPMRSEKNRVLLALANAGRVIDLRGFWDDGVRHQVETCAEALAQMGVECNGELAYDVRIDASCPALDAEIPAGRDIIVVNLFAADAGRSIGHEGVALLRGLRAVAPSALHCVLCTDQTAELAGAVVAGSGTGQLVNCEGNLQRLFRLCERASMVISPDTAVVHVASALGTPVIGIYQDNGVKAIQWAPRSPGSAVVLSACRDTLAGFRVDEVLARVADLRRASDGSLA